MVRFDQFDALLLLSAGIWVPVSIYRPVEVNTVTIVDTRESTKLCCQCESRGHNKESRIEPSAVWHAFSHDSLYIIIVITLLTSLW